MSRTHLTEQKFSDSVLHPTVIEALGKKGLHNYTPIRVLALPLMLGGHDVVGQAQTGTGKTIASLTPTSHYLFSHSAIADRQINQPRALTMAPTCELAVWIHADAEPLAQATGLELGLAYGGDDYDKQLKVLESGVDILVGTTGCLIDYAERNHINLDAIQIVILDEADRMYDLGFIKDIRWLSRHMPLATQRLNMLFSATLSYRVRGLAFEQMNSAEYVEVGPEQKTGHRIEGELFYLFNEKKTRSLRTLPEEEWPDRAAIFTSAKYRCEDIWGHLAADGHHIGLLTGGVAQKRRLCILDEFTRGDLDIPAAIDVAARGLHISVVTHVFSYDLPDDCEDYAHRIGRTGRAGAGDNSTSLAREEYALDLLAIETYIGHLVPVGKCNPDALMIDLPELLHLTRAYPGNGPHRNGSPRNRRHPDQEIHAIRPITQNQPGRPSSDNPLGNMDRA